ncbi:Hypothetical protein ETEE_2717 [Edwardsiella anguillarum ET080813]|uniref:Uncharacterized protein n=1 Tax=Edwardsiella anguillarum ET080813 TaxID=667120 RepID=A0A076LL27_9GAMM|nr:Hypothetical protein ETEE_2717 [Edwardsiella anguillarum ET080813]
MPGHLTVDIGGMPLPRQSVIPPDFDAQVHHVDKRLYQAKNRGRRCLRRRELKTQQEVTPPAQERLRAPVW